MSNEISIQLESQNKVCGGWHKQFSHSSPTLNCTMRFAVFEPPQVEQGQNVPVLYWLSGLTCTDENFMQKAGAFKAAAELGILIVAADTSPRGEEVPDDSEQAYDFGLGAGFYLNATQAPWNQHYQMYDYIVKELPQIVESHFLVNSRRYISGHSMGGHGALTIALKNPDRYRSASAFSPICNPVNCPWGQKAFNNYLGEDQTSWNQYDASLLLQKSIDEKQSTCPILIDQGTDDSFLEEQLKPDSIQSLLETTDLSIPLPITLRMQDGYDHSYFFISSFIEEHLRFHINGGL